MPRARAATGRIPDRVRRLRRAGSVQVFWAVGGVGLALAVAAVRSGPTIPAGTAVNALTTIGFGVLGLISILFSLLFLVVQWVFSELSPRLSTFVDDPSVWRTFGVSIGVFAFSITATLTVASRDRVSVFIPLVELAAALAVIVMMRALQIKGFNTVQLGTALRTITVHGDAVIDRLYPRPFAPDREADIPLGAEPPGHRIELTWPHPPGYLQRLDLDALARAATEADGVVLVHVGFGQSLFTGDLLAEIHAPTEAAARRVAEALLQTAIVGDHRLFNQDPLLAVRLCADITLRALSPAINDPATAVQALEAACHLLRRLADRDLDTGAVRDAGQRVRVRVPTPDWEEFVSTCLDDVVESAARSPLVTRRLAVELDRLESAAPAQRRATIRLRALRSREIATPGLDYPTPVQSRVHPSG